MRTLLGSGGIRTTERVSLYVEETQRHFGDVRQVLFVPWALDAHDAYLALMNERGLDAGYELVGLHTFEDPIAAINDAEAISVGGGNTFRLAWELHRSGAMAAIRNRVINDGIPYMVPAPISHALRFKPQTTCRLYAPNHSPRSGSFRSKSTRITSRARHGCDLMMVRMSNTTEKQETIDCESITR